MKILTNMLEGFAVRKTDSIHRAPACVAAGVRFIASLLATLALTGCVGEILQSKVDEPQTYVLQASDAGTAAVAYPIRLSVALPSATPGLDTQRIVVLRNGNRLDYYYGARWGGTAPQVVQSFLISLLQNQQGYKNVVAESARLDADYLIDIDLRHFQAEYVNGKDAPTIHVALWATVSEVKSRKSVAALQASASVAASDNRLGAVVTAFQSATQQASASLSEQLAASFAK
ncbi:MAG: ABC-type transport auxiliary lipoprotein family protein [Steroidobacteraceae bacterium]